MENMNKVILYLLCIMYLYYHVCHAPILLGHSCRQQGTIGQEVTIHALIVATLACYTSSGKDKVHNLAIGHKLPWTTGHLVRCE